MHDPIDLTITLPGRKHVDALVGDHVIRTDQPVAKGGEDSAPAPYDLFLAAIGTCAGIYVASFCQNRGLPTEDIRIHQRVHKNQETGVMASVELRIEVPPEFPAKYHDALVWAVDGCAVKKAIAAQPTFDVETVIAEASAVAALANVGT